MTHEPTTRTSGSHQISTPRAEGERQSRAELQGQIEEALEALNTAQAELAELEQEMDRCSAA